MLQVVKVDVAAIAALAHCAIEWQHNQWSRQQQQQDLNCKFKQMLKNIKLIQSENHTPIKMN